MADAVGETIDRISSLPDYILLLIVYFLPLDDTLQIRFLSTRFRNLSRSISNIFICRDNPVRPDQSEEFKEKAWTNHEQWTRARKCRLRCFEEFMEKALSNHEQLTRVQKFLLRCSNNDYKSATISNWIHSAITASVSNLVEIDIYAHENLRVKFPRSFFSCRKLRFLRLSGVISVNKIPKGMVFPCLKTLELESISIVSNDNQLNNLLSIGCPVLEYSLLRDFSLNYSWTCPAQRFRYLRGTWVRGDCPNNLSKRVLKHLELYDNDMFDIVTFMGRVGNRPIFEHLTHVVVEVGPETPFLGLRDLLKHSPNLTSLELKKVCPNICKWSAPVSTDFECLSCNLETVLIKNFYGLVEVEVVKYFLKNAKVLKKLVLYVERPLSCELQTSILDEPRASAQCEIEIRSSPD